MQKLDIEFSQYLMAKIFHDMSGNVGTINNALELVNEGEISNQALDLCIKSGKILWHKLILFRQLYGFSKRDIISINDVESMITSFFFDTKVSVKIFFDREISEIPSTFLQPLLGLVIISANSLIYGGNLEIDVSKTSKLLSVFIRNYGNGIRFEDAKKKCLEKGEYTTIDTYNVLFLYTYHLYIEKHNLKIDHHSNSLTFMLSEKF